jgi:hypothetical protein
LAKGFDRGTAFGHRLVIARSIATKQSIFESWIASLRSQ